MYSEGSHSNVFVSHLFKTFMQCSRIHTHRRYVFLITPCLDHVNMILINCITTWKSNANCFLQGRTESMSHNPKMLRNQNSHDMNSAKRK